MYSFPNLEPVCWSMSSTKHCFLTCIQISQEAGKVVWYSHPFKNFPQFFVIHTVQGFCIVNEPEVDAFLEFPCFFYDLTNVDNLISGISTSLKSSFYIWKFSVHVVLKPTLRVLSITLLACEMSTTVEYFEHSLALPFFGTGKIGLFQPCGHC